MIQRKTLFYWISKTIWISDTAFDFTIHYYIYFIWLPWKSSYAIPVFYFNAKRWVNVLRTSYFLIVLRAMCLTLPQWCLLLRPYDKSTNTRQMKIEASVKRNSMIIIICPSLKIRNKQSIKSQATKWIKPIVRHNIAWSGASLVVCSINWGESWSTNLCSTMPRICNSYPSFTPRYLGLLYRSRYLWSFGA